MSENQLFILKSIQDAAAHYNSSILSRKQYISYRLHHDREIPTIERIIRNFESWSNAVQQAGLNNGHTAKSLRCRRCGHRYYDNKNSLQLCSQCESDPQRDHPLEIKQRIVTSMNEAFMYHSGKLNTNRYEKFVIAHRYSKHPSLSSIYQNYKSWPAAMKAAGLLKDGKETDIL